MEKTTEKSLDIVLFDLKEAAEALGVNERTIRQYLYDGKIKGVKIGRKWQISKEALEAFCRGQAQP